MYPVSSSSSSSPATNDISSPLLNQNRRVLLWRSWQPLHGAALRLIRRASSCRMMLRESSVRVRETAAEQIGGAADSGENPQVPLRFWIVVYNLQCLLHVACVISEYRRPHGYDHLNQDWDSGLTSGQGSSEDESNGPGIESGTSIFESTNAIFSCVWWIIGFYWVTAGSEELAQSHLYSTAVFCFLPCIIAVLYALSEREGASDEEIERLPRFKFLTVRNSEKVNGEIRETHGGIMTQLGIDSPSERVLSSDEADCCVCLCDYEDGTELRELWCRHHFHEACIDKWLRINTTCPLCKFNILKPDERSGIDAV
ncbi:RING/U-box superfamily protein [Raphanus sativus]|nr:RING/U-box superfamily protein [Raphanus sativus]